MDVAFTKMNGIGNSFVIIDLRDQAQAKPLLTPPCLRALAERAHPTTHGCDQVLTIEPPRNDGTIYMGIYNADGSEAEACGNGTRAVAAYLGQTSTIIETQAGPLDCEAEPSGHVTVNMGQPRFKATDIPVSDLDLDLTQARLHPDLPPAFIVSMGNPHAVFFVDGPRAAAEKYGAALEHHAVFPNRANINFAQVVNDQHLVLVTWERGAGLTPACGTGACATAVAHDRRHGPTNGAPIRIDAPGGQLELRVADNGVWMRGPTTTEFSGTVRL